MKRVLRGGKDVKAKKARVKELMDLSISELEMDVRLQRRTKILKKFCWNKKFN